MLTMTYPVHGDVNRNVKITVLPQWTQRFLDKTKITFLPAFRRLWVAPHLAPLIHAAEDLWRFDALISQYNALLEQQKAFPVGGIGWWIERKTSIKTRCDQDVLAYGAYIASFNNEKVRVSILANLSETITEKYSEVMTRVEFKKAVWEASKALLEAGGK